MADFDTYAGRVKFDPGSRRSAIMVMHNDVGIRMIDASGNAGSFVANLAANALGMGGIGEREP
jgi:hypothetical protein